MSGQQHDLAGTPVTEAEAATGLGFASVEEFRRWQTAEGQRAADLEQKLRGAENDRDHFRWSLRRMQHVLEKAREAVASGEATLPDDLRLAIGVALNVTVDWDHRLKGWWPEGLGE